MQMQKPFTEFETLIGWVLYRTLGTQESFGIDFILACSYSHFSIYDCLGIGSGNGYWNTTCQKQRWLKQMMWFSRVIVQNQGKEGVKEKTSLHISSVNFRIERPGTTAGVNLKQSALLYCEKWWRETWLQRRWDILWCKRSQSRVTRFAGLKSELKLDASRIRHLGSIEENWARTKIL